MRLIEATLAKCTQQILGNGGVDLAFEQQQGADFQNDIQRPWSDNPIGPMDEVTWAYMQQFLNLSTDDFMLEI